MEHKIRIFENNKDLFEEIRQFVLLKSPIYKRDILISDLLNQKEVDRHYLETQSPVPIEDSYGSTYQSSFRSNDSIYAISHYIVSIGLDDCGFYAFITPSLYGDVIDFNKGVLRPVWYKNENNEIKLATFDIDFNISPDAG